MTALAPLVYRVAEQQTLCRFTTCLNRLDSSIGAGALILPCKLALLEPDATDKHVVSLQYRFKNGRECAFLDAMIKYSRFDCRLSWNGKNHQEPKS